MEISLKYLFPGPSVFLDSFEKPITFGKIPRNSPNQTWAKWARSFSLPYVNVGGPGRDRSEFVSLLISLLLYIKFTSLFNFF